MSYTVLTEWLDTNLHRNFPLTDSATAQDTSGTLDFPTSLISDFFLCVPPYTQTDKYYIKSVVFRRFTLDIEIGYDGDGQELTIGYFNDIPTDQTMHSVYYFEPAPQTLANYKPFTIASGVVVIGLTEAATNSPGKWSFQSDDTPILASRVNTGLAVVNSLMIGSKIFTGNLILKEGAGVTLTPSYDAATYQTTITISADIRTSSELAIPLVSDASIMANLVATYGQPITNINGVVPDTSGNFTLRALDCTEINDISNGVALSNPCSLPCCDKAMLDTIYDSISNLNLRYARMDSYYQSLSRNINDLQSRMIGLEI